MEKKYTTPIRWYSKGQLALKYFPQAATKDIAEKRLMRWIRHCQGLEERLKLLGYKKTRKRLSPRMVYEIFEHLGDP